MKSVVYTQYGPPEVCRLVEVEKPVPNDDEVLIKVYASTVNRTDCGFRSANYFINRFFSGLFKPNQKILGCEFSGEIEQIGKNVSLYKVGDKVFGFDDQKFGGHAEYVVKQEKRAMAILPQDMTFEEAAPITEGSHYALGIIRAARIKAGQRVLVNGATGAIGSAGVQLLRYFGADVTAVCHSQHIDLVKSLGVDKVVGYDREDFTQLGEKFHMVFDAVGKSSFGKCKPLLLDKGIYVSTELGYMSQNPFLALVTPLLKGKRVLFPIPSIPREDVLFLRELVESGKFKPVIDRKYPLEEIVEAYRYVEKGKKIGNVVIRVH